MEWEYVWILISVLWVFSDILLDIFHRRKEPMIGYYDIQVMQNNKVIATYRTREPMANFKASRSVLHSGVYTFRIRVVDEYGERGNWEPWIPPVDEENLEALLKGEYGTFGEGTED